MNYSDEKPVIRRDAAATKARILKAGLAEFGAKGYDGARTVSIAKRAKCNIRMLYHYFGGKKGLYLECLQKVYLHIRGEEQKLSLKELPPIKEGVYVKGVYLEGAGWDAENYCLCEPEPMRLLEAMPIIHFKPVENKKKVAKNIYQCPLYMYPVRTGSRERPSFMISVDLKSCAGREPDHWIKRGTALLLSLAV